MLVTCFSTARSVTTSRSAIAWFERPSAISSSTSRSRGVSSSSGSSRAAAADELRDDRRVERRAALGDAPHRGGELVDVGDAVLEQVADALGAVGEQLERVARLDVLREHEHAGLRDAARGSPARRAGPRRCASAACGCRRSRRPGLYERTFSSSSSALPGLADDLEAGVLEQPRDALAQQDGVVGEHDAEPLRAAATASAARRPQRAGSRARPGATSW